MNGKCVVVAVAGLALVFGCGSPCGSHDGRIHLADRGRPGVYRIQLPQDPLPSETYAAEELKKYVKDLTGVSLGSDGTRAIVLERGPSDLGEDGFHLYVKDGDLHIAGGKRGVLYGVYEILETYGGVGWFSPERTVVPVLDALTVPETLDDTQIPAFELREPLWHVAFDDPDHAAHLRLNGNSPKFTERHGGKSYRFGGGLGNCHTFQLLVPVGKYGKTHPEYFAMRNGRRVVTDDPQHSMQLCLSNPDVLRIATEAVLDAIRKDPTAKYYGVSQNDNKNYCQCPKCAAIDEEEGSHAGTQVRFVNAIAAEVEKAYPDKIIETLAYQYTRKPPKKTRLRKNVMPCLCTIECDFSHPIATGKYKQNVSFREDIMGWKAQTDRLYIWDYTTDYHNFPGVFPNFDALQENIRFFRACGATSLFEQGDYRGRGGEFEALKSWLIAKWMWNPDLPEEPLLDRFFRGFYGKAAPYVREYFDELRRLPREDGKCVIRCFADVNSQQIVTDAYLEKARRLFDLAEAAAKDDPVALQNVRYAAFSVDYVEFVRRKDACLGDLAFSVRRQPPVTDEGRMRFHEASKRLKELLDADPEIFLCENRKRDAERKADIARAAAAKPVVVPFVPCDRVVIEEKDGSINPNTAWSKLVDDPTASGGKALEFYPTDCQWCYQLQMPISSFDRGVKYRLRAKLKFKKRPGAPAGNAVSAGVCSPASEKGVASWTKRSAQVKDGEWEWVDLGTWTPTDAQYLWMSIGTFDRKKDGSNPAIERMWLDQLEISRAERRFSDARWIWPAELVASTNTVVEFRRTFVSPKAGTAKLTLASDTVYSVSLNGRFVHTGRFPDVPPMRFYDELTLGGLVAGTNELIVAVYAQGIGSFQHWEGDSGLLYALDAEGVRVTSGTDDVWRLSSGYRSEGVPLVTRQIGFSFSHDARTPERSWRRLSAADGRRDSGDFDLRPRPVAQVAVEPAVPTHVIGQGTLDGSPVSADKDVAKGMDATGLRPCPAADFFAEDERTVRPSFFDDGFFVTVDLGREECGLLSLDVETDAGTIIDIGHAEHIEDGRIHVAIGDRNFAGRYRAREGRQTFVNWVHRMAGRYIQIHVRGAKTRFVLNGLTVRPTVYPVEEASVPDWLTPVEREIWKVSVRTLRLCMHEHYEDCPWREQALYGNDSRNQMLAGYFAFADRNGMPELSLELLSRGLDEKGWIELCMPAKIGLAIPSFTFSWVLALGDHLKYRHDIAFTKSMMPALRKVMDARADELVDGLLPCPRGKRYWQFYDWEKDLSGSLSKALMGEDAAVRDQFEAPLNLFAVLAFESAARCAEAVRETGDAARWRQAADRIRSAVCQKLWNKEKRQIETRLGGSLAPAELSQALALLANAVPEADRDAVVRKLSAPSEWTPTSLSQSLYKYEALLSAGGSAAEAARREIAEVWSGMLCEGATSFWEVRTGWKAFGGAGSLCHGWSAIPVYFYGAYLNGKKEE